MQKTCPMKAFFCIFLIALSLGVSHVGRAAPISWTTGTTGDASGAWSGSATTFNGQSYTAADDLFIDGSATKTITLTGTITTPLSLTINGTGTSGTTVVSSVSVAGAGAITLTGTSLGGTLSKSGSADLVLASANTLGAVTLSGGKFFLNSAAGLGTTGTLTVNSGAASGVSASYVTGAVPGTGTPDKFFFDSTGINASYTFSKDITFGTVGSATTYGMVMRGGQTRTTTLSGNISGASNVTLRLDTSSSGDGSSIWSLTGADNSGFAGPIFLNRGRLFLGNANAAGTGRITINTNTSAAGNLVFNFAGTVANAITISTAGNVVSPAANNVTLSGVVSSSVGWAKAGTGTLTLTNANNTITGATTISDGTLAITGSGRMNTATYAGAITLTAATSVLDFAGGGSSWTGVISGLGSLKKSGGSTLTVGGAGNSTFSGGVTLTSGTLRVQTNDTALGTGTITVTSNTVDTSASPVLATASAGGARVLANNIAITNNGTGITTLNLDGGFATLTLNGEISGTGGLATTSTGTIVLGGTNTYTGTTTVNSSLLRLDSASALPGGVATAGGISALLFNGSGADGVVGLTAATGDFTRSIGGTTPTAVQVGWSNGGTGGFAAFGGDRTVNFGGAAASQTWSNSGGVFGGGLILGHSTADSTITVANPIVLNVTGARTVTVNDGSAAVDAILSGVLSTGVSAFTKAGAGTLALTAANTYGSTYTTGTTFTTISAGTLQLGTGGTTGSLTSTGTGDIQNNGTLAVNRSNAVSLAYVIKGTGAVTQLGAGTTTLTAANTYSGTTTVTNGTLALTSTGSTGTGAVTVQTGGTILGTGLLLGSTFTAQIGSTVHAGNGTAQGDYGTLTFTPASGSGSFDFQSGSSVILGINPGGAGDLLNFDGLLNGTLLFNGGLQVTAGSYVPMSTETFNLLDWSNVGTPTFDSRYSAGSYSGFLLGNGDDNLGFDLPNIAGSGYGWDISQFTTNGTISVVVVMVPEPARASLLLAGLCALLMRRRRSL